jgi:hypothetical protein
MLEHLVSEQMSFEQMGFEQMGFELFINRLATAAQSVPQYYTNLLFFNGAPGRGGIFSKTF